MIFKFKSAASGDVIMLGPHGDAMLRLLGREPSPKGIVEPCDMAAALAALRAAIEQAERQVADPSATPTSGGEPADAEPPVSLRRRLWPMIDLLERAARADVPVVWGV